VAAPLGWHACRQDKIDSVLSHRCTSGKELLSHPNAGGAAINNDVSARKTTVMACRRQAGYNTKRMALAQQSLVARRQLKIDSSADRLD